MIELRVQAGAAAASSLTQVKLLATRFPGDHELTIVVYARPSVAIEVDPFSGGQRSVPTTPAPRRLTLGEPWRYDASPACLSALAEFGEVVTPDR